MGGNVWEWCDRPKTQVKKQDPKPNRARDQAPTQETLARGGGWCSPSSTGRVTSRRSFHAGTRWAGLGFRPVLRWSSASASMMSQALSKYSMVSIRAVLFVARPPG